MPELLTMFRRRGYTFVSLDRALADEAYKLPEEYVGRGGFHGSIVGPKPKE